MDGTQGAWRLFHKAATESTNSDARAGRAWDAFTADYQIAGRGRLDHTWQSPPGENLTMSAVLPADGAEPAALATLPLAAGLAVAEALESLRAGGGPRGGLFRIKWPNDVLAGGRKVAGILCERTDDRVIVGVGVNVRQREFPAEIADRATSLALMEGEFPEGLCVADVRDAVLASLARVFCEWSAGGFAAVLPRIARLDALRGRGIAVASTDADASPLRGVCGGIQADGSLLVGTERAWAGEAHVLPLSGSPPAAEC